MAASVNKVILIGNLGREPETRVSTNGKSICTLALATSRYYKDAQNNPVSETEWHRIVLFGSLADVASNHLHKGSQAYIEGRLRTREYVDKNNIKRYQTEVICESLQLLGRPQQGGYQPRGDYPLQGGGYQYRRDYSQQGSRYQQGGAGGYQQQAGAGQNGPYGLGDEGEDIPFESKPRQFPSQPAPAQAPSGRTTPDSLGDEGEDVPF